MFSPSFSPESVGVRLPRSWVSATNRSMFALSRDPFSRKVLPHEICTGCCGMRPSTSSQDVFGLVDVVVYRILLDKQCRKHIRFIILTREFADTAPEARYHLWKVGRKRSHAHSLRAGPYMSPGLPHRSSVRSHLSMVAPSCTKFFDAGVH